MAAVATLRVAIVAAAALSAATAAASQLPPSPFVVPTIYMQTGDVGAPLARLPGLNDSLHPAPATLADFAEALVQRGLTASMTQEELVALHEPFAEVREHTAIHEGAGLVSLNATGALMPHVVHLDEFVPSLFTAYNATWSCSEVSTVQGLGLPIFGSVINFIPRGDGVAPPEASHTSVVLAYLLARLTAPNATIAWGQRLLDLHHGNSDDELAPLFDGSCDEPLVNRSSAPYFAVAAADLLASSSDPSAIMQGFAVRLTLVPVPLLHIFAYIKKSLRLDPNMTQSLEQNPHAPLVLADGTRILPGERSNATDTAFAEGHANNRRVRRVQLSGSLDTTLTGTGNQVTNGYNVAGWDWNYGGATGVECTAEQAPHPSLAPAHLNTHHASLPSAPASLHLHKTGRNVTNRDRVRHAGVAVRLHDLLRALFTRTLGLHGLLQPDGLLCIVLPVVLRHRVLAGNGRLHPRNGRRARDRECEQPDLQHELEQCTLRQRPIADQLHDRRHPILHQPAL